MANFIRKVQPVLVIRLDDLPKKKTTLRSVFAAIMFVYFNYPKCHKSEKFFLCSQRRQVIQFHWEDKTKGLDCFAKKCKTATLFKHSAESTFLPNAQLGPEQNIFLFIHLTLPSVCCLARLSLMHLFMGRKKKKKHLHISLPAELLRSAAK